MNALEPKKLVEIYDGADKQRKEITRRVEYYDGKHSILKRTAKYADGSTKTNRVTNFIKYIVDMYTGAMTAQPYQIVSKTEDKTGIDLYAEIDDYNALQAQDIENLRNALLIGFAVERHEFIGGKIVITNSDPREWIIFRNDRDVIVGALRKICLAAGTVTNSGEYLSDKKELITLYTDTEIIDYALEGSEWKETAKLEHKYGRVPVIVWQIDDRRKPIISDALIGQQDEFNDIDSASGDEIRQFVDCVLKIKGYDAANVKAMEEAIKTMRVLPLAIDGDAEYMSRNTQTEPTENKLNRTRQAIHLMGQVPDIESIVGATGDTSGIALQLKFMPMIQRAKSMSHYIKMGLTERIDLINAIKAKQTGKEGGVIRDYKITISFHLPTNRIEEWKNIGMLNGIVSQKTQLELLTDIEDAEAEMERLRAEGVAPAGAKPAGKGIEPDGTAPATITTKNEVVVADAAAQAAPLVQQVLTGIDMALRDAIMKSGAIERALAGKTK